MFVRKKLWRIVLVMFVPVCYTALLWSRLKIFLDQKYSGNVVESCHDIILYTLKSLIIDHTIELYCNVCMAFDGTDHFFVENVFMWSGCIILMTISIALLKMTRVTITIAFIQFQFTLWKEIERCYQTNLSFIFENYAIAVIIHIVIF